MTELLSNTIRLVSADVSMLDAEDHSGGALAKLLRVPAPVAWPPEHNGPQTRRWVRERLSENPDHQDWFSWYVLTATNELAGIAGYKGPPNAEGEVEIGYSILPTYQGRGLATEGARLLGLRAFADQKVTSIVAHTLPHLKASQAVLLKAGFAKVREFQDSEDGLVWQYRLTAK